MAIFISTLARGINEMEQVATMVDGWNDPNLGVELIAFTHDQRYWERLTTLLPQLHCPLTFHGPYVAVEGTAPTATLEQEWLLQSYDRVFTLATQYHVRHVVFHTTQLGWSTAELPCTIMQSYDNIRMLNEMAQRHGVTMLVENLPYPKVELPLYSNQAYCKFFDDFPQANALIDIGHAHMNGLELSKLLPKLNNRILGYHFHNNDGKNDLHNRIGNGTFCYKQFGKLYQEFTPSANIVLEYEPHTKCTEKDFIEDIQTVCRTVSGN